MKTIFNQGAKQIGGKMFLLLFSLGCFFLPSGIKAQGVAINNSGSIADASAMLDVSSTTKGVLSPRMTTANRNSIASPAIGLQVFNTDCNIFEVYTGSCWISMSKFIQVPDPIICSGTTDFCAGETRIFTIPPVLGATNYFWTLPAGATFIAGQGTTSVTALFGNNSGVVYVTAGNACETSAARFIDIHVNPIPSTPGNITGLTNVYPGDNGISYFIASIVGATLYNWTVPAGCVITSGIGTSNIMIRYPCNATSNNISVTASTNCGASPPSGLAITVNPVLSASAGPAVFGGVAIGGSPTASGGKAPYTYAWSPSANLSSTVATNPIALCSGSTTTYTVTVTDVNGCTASNAVVVTRNLIANAGSPQTGPGTIGSSPTATGGQIPYSYSWSPSSGLSSTTIANPYANACATTTYSLTVTDANGCTSTNSITVTRNIVASAGSSFSGPGTIGGSPTVTGGKSPYTYSWNTSSGLSSTTVANPYATSCVTTTYTITVTDINSCTASNSITVTRNIAANAGSNLSRYTGTTSCDTIGINPAVSGGLPPYTYSWSPSVYLSSSTVTRPQANPTTTTTYTITVTDANACTATSSMTFTVLGYSPVTYSYTGSSQTFTVPTCVTSLTIEAWGAQGGNSGGYGGYAKGTTTVLPGQTLYIYVGGQGTGSAGYNGGGNAGANGGYGGGGESDVRTNTAYTTVIIVAGGGGGDISTSYIGGAGGGGTTGTSGSNQYQGGIAGIGWSNSGNGTNGGSSGGSGGTTTHGGGGGGGGFTSGGGGGCENGYSPTTCGATGTQGQGGAGIYGPNNCSTAGGGGGYYGGGGSSAGNCGGGGAGGGSSATFGLSNVTFTGGVQSGNGKVVITY